MFFPVKYLWAIIIIIFFAIRQLPIICHSNYKDFTTLIRIDSWNWIYEIFIIYLSCGTREVKYHMCFWRLIKKWSWSQTVMPTPLKRQISDTAVIYSYKIMFLHTPLYQGSLSKGNNFSSDIKIMSIFLYPTFFSTCDKVNWEEFCTPRTFLKALSVLGFFEAIYLHR